MDYTWQKKFLLTFHKINLKKWEETFLVECIFNPTCATCTLLLSVTFCLFEKFRPDNAVFSLIDRHSYRKTPAIFTAYRGHFKLLNPFYRMKIRPYCMEKGSVLTFEVDLAAMFI